MLIIMELSGRMKRNTTTITNMVEVNKEVKVQILSKLLRLLNKTRLGYSGVNSLTL